MSRPESDYQLPVGEVIMYGVYYNPDKTPEYVYKPTKDYTHIAESMTWWTPPDNVDVIRKLAKEFPGFKFMCGDMGQGTKEMPEVIEDETQERKAGRMWAVSTKGVQALVGDILVWLEIKDEYKALETLGKRTDLPCAVRCDIYRYSDEKDYKKVFDKANNYFIEYYTKGKPVDISKIDSSKEFMTGMYDV